MKSIKLSYHSVIESEENNCHFWTDGKFVFYERNNIPLKNAHPEKMRCWRNFAYDDERVFLRNKPLRGVSPVGFMILNYSFVKTNSHVITENGYVKVNNDSVVQTLDNGMWYGSSELAAYGYIKIDNTIWYHAHWNDGLTKLTSVNANHFISLQDRVLGMDDKKVYAFGKIVAGASVKDFRKIIDCIYCGYYISNGKLFFENKMIREASIDMIYIPDEVLKSQRSIRLLVCDNRYYAGEVEVSYEIFEKWLNNYKEIANKQQTD